MGRTIGFGRSPPIERPEDERPPYPAFTADVDTACACEVSGYGRYTAKHDGSATGVIAHDGNLFLDEDQIEAG